MIIPPKTLYVSSGLHQFLSAVGQPKRVQDFVGRKATRKIPSVEWKITFLLADGEIHRTGYANESKKYYTAELYRGSFVINIVEWSQADLVGYSSEVSIAVTNSFVIPLWSIAMIALAFPVYQFLPTTRRKRRREAGLCENCGYDLRGSVSGTCSECGVGISVHVK
ncbi:MAG TPA: hypothetical protein PKN33_00570 [Phycisphaerae bacterium]|nr:hypothetical protein [Phycisphaerae bacterium]